MERVGQPGVFLQAQPFAPDGGVEAAGGDDGGELLLGQLPAGLQTVDQRFPAEGEAGADGAPKVVHGSYLHRRRFPGDAAHHGGRDLGRRQKAGVGDGEQQLRLGVILHQHRERAVVRRAGGGADALGHLLLYEDGEAVEAARLHAGGEEGRGDVVGQVGAQYRAQAGEVLPHQGGQLLLHDVALHQREVGEGGHGLRQHRRQPAVQLHGHDFFRPAGQLHRQRADARADLQHAAALRASGGGDVLRHPALDEEVLPQGFGEAEAVAGQQGLYIVAVTKVHERTPYVFSS